MDSRVNHENDYGNMIKIKLLAQFPNYIPELAQIWADTIGQKFPSPQPIEQVQKRFKNHLNQDILPLSYVAMDDDKPIGMCSLRMDDGISRPELFPWLGGLCVTDSYRKRGIGKLLLTVVKTKTYKMGFKKIYLLTFDDRKIIDWYAKLGWKEMKDEASIDGQKVVLMSIDLHA